MRRQARHGVTLIEVLIAVTLVSLLTVGILFAMRVGLGAMDATERRFARHRRVIGAQRLLDQQIAGLIPAQVQCGGSRSAPALFFHGDETTMRFVSSHTLEEGSRGYPRIIEYLVTPGEEGEGVRLLMNEYLYTGPSVLEPLCAGSTTDPRTQTLWVRQRPVTMGPRPFVIADKLRGCRFSYLMPDGQVGRKAWMRSFAGSYPPAAIRVDMLPLTADPSRVPMTTVTIPVRVSRNGSVFYYDIDPPPPPQ